MVRLVGRYIFTRRAVWWPTEMTFLQFPSQNEETLQINGQFPGLCRWGQTCPAHLPPGARISQLGGSGCEARLLEPSLPRDSL